MRRFLAFALLLMGVSLANAQAPTVICTPTTAGSCVPVNAANPLPISGSFSATLTGFLSNNLFATLTATNTTSASTALPTGATANPSIRITNNGTTVVSCTMATGAATGLTSNILVQPGSSVSRVVGTFDHIACIDQTGSVSNPVVIEGGSGLGNDSGGGGGGGSGGSVTQGTTPWVTSGAGASGAVLTGNPFRVGLSDGTNNQNWLAAIALADGVNGNNTGAVAAWLWNGATYDRWPGNLTNGAFVKVTNTNTNGQATMANSSPVAISSNQSTLPTQRASDYPVGATAITASATGTTGATTATLAGTGGKTTFICGYSIRANATAATTVTNTITGVITATLSSIMWIAPAASGIGVDEMVFSPCIPASAVNTGIAIVSGAPGTGGNVSSKGWGYQL